MPSLFSTDLAAVSTGSKLYLYYQDDAAKNIREASSDDGAKWEESSTVVGDECDPNGSPITAYYVGNDSSFHCEATIHVLYIDSHKNLREKVKVVSKGDSWEEISVPSEIKKAPDPTSKLASGTCHNSQSGAHQWVYFVRTHADTNIPEVAELRRHDTEGSEWVLRKALPQTPASALPGTSLAVSLTDQTTHLFFQDHSGNILQYDGSYEEWSAPKQFVPKGQVSISTPLTTANPNSSDKPLCFFVGGAHSQICDGKENIGSSIPGTKLGAAVLGKRVFIFHKAATSATSISAIVSDESAKTWSGDTVIVVKG